MAEPTTGTFTANGSTSEIRVLGGQALLFVGDSDGSNFGGGTVVVDVMMSNGTDWGTSADSYTAIDVDRLDFGESVIIRLTLSGATTPDLNWEVRPQ